MLAINPDVRWETICLDNRDNSYEWWHTRLRKIKHLLLYMIFSIQLYFISEFPSPSSILGIVSRRPCVHLYYFFFTFGALLVAWDVMPLLTTFKTSLIAFTYWLFLTKLLSFKTNPSFISYNPTLMIDGRNHCQKKIIKLFANNYPFIWGAGGGHSERSITLNLFSPPISECQQGQCQIKRITN